MKTLEVVAAVIMDGGRVFATQRGYGAYKDWWEFPGGKMEAGETREAALIREIKEELSAEISVQELLGTVEWDYPDFHLVMHCFRCSVRAGELTLNEHQAARWLTGENLREVAWLPADVAILDQVEKRLQKPVEPEPVSENDPRLRLLYLYRLLSTQSDEDHPISSKQIMDWMLEEHGISMHRTTVPSDIALLKAAGYEIIGERRRAWEYYLADRTFSVPELKLLIDAVQSSKFITEKKSQTLIEKLISLTSETNAAKLKRTVHITGRSKSENEKGYYIVDAINDAMNAGVKISFFYFDYNDKKKHVLKNDEKPYTVSPYDLIWDGDYYYLIGYCDERGQVRTFRVDRIDHQPVLLTAPMEPQPKGYNVTKYTQEVFRMFATQEVSQVTLRCKTETMKSVIDQFGPTVHTKSLGKGEFQAKVKVCASPTFYRWVFGFGGKIRIVAPEEIREEYKAMLTEVLAGV